MWIKNLSLKNFRCFRELAEPAQFHKSMNVLAATNGRGKSSILDAITIALTPYASHFEHGDSKTISKTDATLALIPVPGDSPSVTHSQEALYPVVVGADLQILEDDVTVAVVRRTAKGRTSHAKAGALRTYAEKMGRQLREKHPDRVQLPPLPVLSYYGTGRLHAQKRLMQKHARGGVHNPNSRTMGYLNCLSAESTYKHFAEWMKNTTLAQLQETAEGYLGTTGNDYQGMLNAVQTATDVVLNGQQWKDLRYSVKKDELTVFSDDTRLPLASLSDGLRSIIALFGDLAYRCIILNPQLGAGAPTQTPGIVLIDEIEMHLHPAWQQQIIAQLQRAFPNIQFICTTHSPQVLSTVRPESIRTISNDGRISSPMCKTYGAESKRVLEELMGVDARPPALQPELKEFIKLTDGGDWFSSRYQELREILIADLGTTDPVLIDADIKRSFQQLEVSVEGE